MCSSKQVFWHENTDDNPTPEIQIYIETLINLIYKSSLQCHKAENRPLYYIDIAVTYRCLYEFYDIIPRSRRLDLFWRSSEVNKNDLGKFMSVRHWFGIVYLLERNSVEVAWVERSFIGTGGSMDPEINLDSCTNLLKATK